MLSKLVRLAPAARMAPQLAPMFATRSFHSTKPFANLVTKEEREGPSGTIVDTPGVIDQYGYIPFVGLLATALVSKEVFIIDEAFLLAMNTITVGTVAYIGLGSSVNDFFQGERDKEHRRYHDVFNAVLEQVNLYKSIESKKLEKVGVIRDLCTESRKINGEYLTFLDIKQKHEARSAMITKLESIKKREAGEEAAEYQALVTEAIEDVRDSYLEVENSELRQSSLEFAIRNIGDIKDAQNDPVRIELESTIQELMSEQPVA